MTDALDVAWIERPLVGEAVCGDRVEFVTDEHASLLAVIDGLGHGPHAASAAEAAGDFIRAHAQLPLDELVRRCHAEIRQTRGVALAVIRIVHASLTLEHAGVGNVDLVSTAGRRVRAVSEPGIVGGRVRKVVASEHQLERGDVLVLHSDGISRRLRLDELRRPSARATAEAIVAGFAKDHDDVSCAVVLV